MSFCSFSFSFPFPFPFPFSFSFSFSISFSFSFSFSLESKSPYSSEWEMTGCGPGCQDARDGGEADTAARGLLPAGLRMRSDSSKWGFVMSVWR